MIVTLCGAERFKTQIIHVAHEIELLGFAVFLPTFIPKSMLGKLVDADYASLHKAHERKIDASDCVYVIDAYRYVGNDTRREIEYAKQANKPVFYNSTTLPSTLYHELYSGVTKEMCATCGSRLRMKNYTECVDCRGRTIARQGNMVQLAGHPEPWSETYTDDMTAELRRGVLA